MSDRDRRLSLAGSTRCVVGKALTISHVCTCWHGMFVFPSEHVIMQLDNKKKTIFKKKTVKKRSLSGLSSKYYNRGIKQILLMFYV